MRTHGDERVLVSAGLPATGGRLGSAVEDFVVDEELAFALEGSGDHLFVRVEKRLLTTRELVQIVARAAATTERDVGYAGLKDKRAVTTQWLSVPGSVRPPESWSLPADVEIIETARHPRKLRTGQQRGNRFCLRLVDVDANSAERAQAILQRIEQHGLLNYFGEQRFGRDGDNVEAALSWLRRGAPGGGTRGRFLKKLYPSVLQSEIFNRYVTDRSAHGFDSLLRGEVVRLAGSASVFVVEDVERELPRLRSRDIVPTGPLPGPKMKRAAHAAAELEARALEALGLSPDELLLLGRLAPGTRRDVLVFPARLALRSEPGALVLEFFLPSGSYATELVRELTQVRGL